MTTLVRSKMSHRVHVCTPTETLARAAQIMWDADVGWLPVLDAEDKLVGVVTDRDICMAALTRGIRLCDADVESVMSRKVVCAHEGDSLAELEQVMKISQLRRFPVVDDRGHPIGVITLSDLARAELELSGDDGDARTEGIAFALAVIAGPRHRALLAAE